MESADRQPIPKENLQPTKKSPMKKTPRKRYFSPEAAVKKQRKYVFDEKKFIKAKQKQHMLEKEMDKKDGKKNFKHAKRENQDGRGDGKKDFKHEKVGKFRKKTGFNPRGRPISKDKHGKTKEPASSRDKSPMKKTPGKRYFSPQEAVKNLKHAKCENQDSRGDGKKDFKHKKVGKFRKKTGFNPRGRPISKDKHGKTKEPAFSRGDRDPFPGEAPVSQEKMKKYMRGKQLKNVNTKSRFQSKMLQMKEKKLTFAAKQAARAELINQEEPGYLQADEHEETEDITQHDIADVVDITSAQKFFELKMNDFGPYRINYTRNGRFLLLGGRKGHVAAIDWMTKKLLCELNAMETLNDVRWLHQETMYAVAQKQWTYIYDNQGIELHCLKVLDRVLRMEFLPFHFLLATAHSSGYLSYIDVSVGEKVAGHHTWHGRLDVMCQNPTNAIVHLGHPGGKVTLWSPTVKEPLVKMLCHQTGVRSVAVDKGGLYMATSSIDRTLKIWDLRTYKTLQSYKLGACASQLAFSHTGLLAAGVGDIVQVYKDCCQRKVEKPYMSHNLTSTVNSLQFCPYEDVLGVGHGNGFTSLLIPGAGEANFDALEANPYQTKKQRREAEVKMLLDKVPVDMIHIDSSIISRVDEKTVQEKMDEKNKYLYGRLEKKDFVPRYKMKGKSKTGKKEQRKKGVIEEDRRQKIKDRLTLVRKEAKAAKQNKIRKSVEYMATSSIDRTLKIWDLRTYKTLQSYKLGACASQLAFSHTGLLAAGVGDIVQVYKDCCQRKVDKPYMSHNLTSTVNSLQFCPYEDVLGVGHGNGFTSLLIPGAGEANFDALEANPYQTKKQRREAEVKMLLDKVPVDMIHIDSSIISRVDKKTVQEKMDEKNKYLYGRLEKKDFVPRYKMKGKSKTGKKEQRKKGVIEEDRQQKIKDRLTLVRKEAKAAKQNKIRKSVESGNVLDRFFRKDT